MTPQSAPELEVRDREVASWQRLEAADLTGYLSLLHDDVMMRPGDRPSPVGKNGIFQHLVAMLPSLQARALTVDTAIPRYAITPRTRRLAISSDENPRSASTSSVCWPSVGAARVEGSSVSPKTTALVIVR